MTSSDFGLLFGADCVVEFAEGIEAVKRSVGYIAEDIVGDIVEGFVGNIVIVVSEVDIDIVEEFAVDIAVDIG